MRAYSKSKDDTYAFASAMGASVQRMLNKVSGYADTAEDFFNGLTTGSLFDKLAKDDKSKKKSTDTSKKVTDRLNNDKVKQEGEQQAQKEGKLDASGQNHKKKEDKLQVAATVGVTVALHDAAVTISGPIDSGRVVSLTAQNASNFNTRTSAAAINTGEVSGGKTIALAAAGSTGENAVGGNVALIVSRNTVNTIAEQSDAQAGGEAAFASRFKDDTYAIAGSIAVATSK